MSTRSKTAAIIASAGVLAAGWQLGTAGGQTVTAATTNPTTTVTVTATPSTTTTTPTTTTPATTTTDPSSTGETYTDGTFTGATSTNRYGSETVTVTISNGQIAEVSTQSQVYEQRSQRYVDRAVPVLRQEVLAANSADVSMVSGATYTSRSYLSSLQSALDQAST